MKTNNNNCIIVNLFGAPGSGKSTGAAYVFSCLKMLGVNTELVTEFAKDMVWDETHKSFEADAQAYLFGNQLWRLLRCADKVDVIVTDSPILLNIPYNKSETLGEDFNRAVASMFKSFNNMSFLVSRKKQYQQIGRVHSETESDQMHAKIQECLEKEGVEYTNIDGDLSGYHEIFTMVMKKLKE